MTMPVSYTHLSGTWTSVRVPGPNTYIDFDTGLVPNAADPGMEWELSLIHI